MSKFKKMTDEKLELFVKQYEMLPIVRETLITLADYKIARFECYFRYKDDSIQRIDFFENNPLGTLEDYENYKNN